MLDPLTLDQIRTFVAVADSGSFRAAAAALSRVQSGVSVSIANLEEQLGVRLFDRSGHRPTLTEEGQTLLADGRSILLRVDAMRARARGFSEGIELELSVVVDSLFPIQRVGNALKEVRARYPSVSIRLAHEPLGAPLQALLEKRTTLAVMVGEDFRDSRITYEALAPIAQVAVVARDHPLSVQGDTPSIELSDLASHLQIVLADPTHLSAGRDFGVLSPQTCRVSTQEAKHELILAGLGWGRLPFWLVEADLQAGRLVRLHTGLLGRDSKVDSESYLARRIDQPYGPVARTFATALKSQFVQQSA